MTQPNSTTTSPDNAAVPSSDNADLGRKCDLLLLGVEQRQREQALKRSRCATIDGLDLCAAMTTGSSSNTKLPTAPAATPKDDGEPGPSCRRGQPLIQTTEQWERRAESRNILTPRLWEHMPRPNMLHPETSRFNANIKHPNTTTTVFKTGSMGGTPSGYLAFGLPYPPRHRRPSFSTNTTHPNIWCRGTPTRYVTPEAPTMERWERENALRKMMSSIIREPNVLRPETPRSSGILDHSNAEAIDLLTKPMTSTLSNLAAPGASGPAYTDASGMAGPSKVVTTVTRSSRTMSASEIFREVRGMCY